MYESTLNNKAQSSQSKVQSVHLKYLSQTDLLNRFSNLVQTERKITHIVLEYIAEIDRRRIYLELAYPSLFEFLVKKHGYSPAAAMRRIESARLLKEIPEIAVQIKEGSLNLSQISQVQQAFKTVQKQEYRKISTQDKLSLLKKIENTTQVETQVIIAQELNLPVPVQQNRITHHQDESVSLTLHLNAEEVKRLEKAKDLLGHAVQDQSWVGLITYLAANEIKRRTKPRQGKVKLKTSKENLNNFTSATEVKALTLPVKEISPTQSIKTSLPSRTVSMSLRKILFSRSACCEYKDTKTGRQCRSTKFLEVDHIKPVWAGGANEPSNLRLLCSEHNKVLYRKQTSTKVV